MITSRVAAYVLTLGAAISIAMSTGGCAPSSTPGNSGPTLQGSVGIDGSSTVYLITEGAAEEFRAVQPDVKVTIGISGTSGGFKRFTVGETDISDASRAIKEPEVEACAKNGIEYLELEVAFDGMAVVVSRENDWVDCLTVEQLRELWRPESGISKWSDLNPDWPSETIRLYGPGTDSGTFQYFTEAVVGESGASRSDYTASEDDNVLVQGVSADKYALGYFGLAYFVQNQGKLKLLGIDGGGGCVQPSHETVRDGTYTPLGRPLFLYVNTKSLKRPEVSAFLHFYLDSVQQLSEEVGYVALTDDVLAAQQKILTEALGGPPAAGQ